MFGGFKSAVVGALYLTCAGAALSAASSSAQAREVYPNKPVRIIVGFPAGSSADILARIYADKMGERFGQRYLVENLTGGSSNVSAGVAARAAPDGYTLYFGSIANAISMSLYDKLNYKMPDDFAPIALIGSATAILAVNPALKVNSVRDFIAAAKAQPGAIMYGSAGVGTGPHLAAELFNMTAGVKLTHVPYKGTNQAAVDLVGGQISAIFAPLPTVAGFVQDGRVKALAVSSAKRSVLAPDLPTLDEAGLPGFDVTLWWGFLAPKGTPRPILVSLAQAVNDAMERSDVKQQLAANGAEPMAASLDDFDAYICSEVAKWAKVVAFSGAKPE